MMERRSGDQIVAKLGEAVQPGPTSRPRTARVERVHYFVEVLSRGPKSAVEIRRVGAERSGVYPPIPARP